MNGQMNMQREGTPVGVGVPMFIVSLASATDRRVLMQQAFAEAGLVPHFFDACDRLDPAVCARLDEMPDRGPWGPFKYHDKACTLSHLDALRAFLDTGAPLGLILEDDVFVSSELATWLADLSWWPEGAELVKLERWKGAGTLVCLSAPVAQHLGRQICRLRNRYAGAAGYLITRAGAQRVLDAGAPDMPIDHLLFNMPISAMARALQPLQVVPALVLQGNEPPNQGPRPPEPAHKPAQPTPTRTEKLRRGWAELAPAAEGLLRILTRRGSYGRITYADKVAN